MSEVISKLREIFNALPGHLKAQFRVGSFDLKGDPMEIKYIPTNDKDAEGLLKAEQRCYADYLEKANLTKDSAAAHKIREYDFRRGFEYGVGWIIQRPLGPQPEAVDMLEGRCKICGQGEEADHGGCINIAMQRLADRHNTENNAQILIMDEMLDHMPAEMRVIWHGSQYGQTVISALLKALIKLGVINCEEVVYKHINKGSQAQAVPKAKEDPGS